jgi:excinuclease ABC subunit C
MYITEMNEERLRNLPDLPGVYLLKNAKGKVIYIGKAKSLKNRIRSYCQESADLRKESMMREVIDLEYILTATELEALILESNLIKKERPKFNVILRDDKNYPTLRIDVNETWPRLQVVRRMKRDGALYFGPYVPAGAMWETLSFIRKTFPLCTCKRDLSKPCRPCIEYEMGRCLAPCAGLVTKEEYHDVAEEVRLFLQGKNKDLINGLEKRMEKASEEMAFEEAAKLRDRIKALSRVLEKQRIIYPDLPDIDAIGISRNGGIADIQILFLRNGILLGRKDFLLKNITITDSEVLYSFLEQFYTNEILPPAEIVLPIEIPDKAVLEAWLTERKGKALHILVPKKGRRTELLNMAEENAIESLRGYQLSAKGKKEVLKDIKERLKLKRIPKRIEAFDISDIHGTEAVGSMVSWEDNAPKKTDYRHFRIRTVEGIDDLAMMSEIIGRRYKRVLEEKGTMPDLIIVDGGKGHLNAALKVLSDLNLREDIDIIGIAKKKGELPDRIYLPGMADPLILPSNSVSTHLLQRIRDESHRFAISYHRKLRKKRTLFSPLDSIPGIGRIRKKALLAHFGTYKKIKEASIDELMSVLGITEKVAQKLHKSLGREG